MLMSDAFSSESSALIIADLMTAMQTMKRKINVMQMKIHVDHLNRQSLRVEIDCLCIRVHQLEG